MSGGGFMLAGSDLWWVYFGRWWEVVGLFWVMAGDGG